MAQCGATVEQWNSDSGAGWWISGTVLVEQWNSDGGTVIVEQFGGIVKQCLWNGVVEQWNSESATVLSNSVGGTVEQ